MICPNCGKRVSQEIIKCPNCQFDLSKAFKEFYKREKGIHNKIKRIRIKQDKRTYDERINLTDFLFIIASEGSFRNKLIEYGISDEEWNCLQFKLISKIYLNEITKKSQIEKELDNLFETYDGEYKFKIDILSKNLTNLINLAGINPFSKYYIYQLNYFKLSIIEGLEVLGRVIDDLLYGEIRLEDLDLKIKKFMKETSNEPERLKYEKGLNNAINEYFVLTGRDYFSTYFENELMKHVFTIDDAYNIKELFLKKIIVENVRKNLKAKLNDIISSYFSNSDSCIIISKDIVHLTGDTYSYYDSMKIVGGLKKNKKKNKNKSKKKSKKKKSRENRDEFIKIKSEELGSDEYSYEDQLDFEREILGDF